MVQSTVTSRAVNYPTIPETTADLEGDFLRAGHALLTITTSRLAATYTLVHNETVPHAFRLIEAGDAVADPRIYTVELPAVRKPRCDCHAAYRFGMCEHGQALEMLRAAGRV